MSVLGESLDEAVKAFRARQLDAAGLASWARDQIDTYLSDPANRYAFSDDVVLEALSIVGAADESPDPRLDVDDAMALILGKRPFSASRLLMLDPDRVGDSAAKPAKALLVGAAGHLDRGEDPATVAGALAAPLAKAVEGLEGNDYVELLALEAVTVAEDLRMAVNGTVEVLGKGRPRIDAQLLADRLSAIAQILGGERPFRATVRGRGQAVHVVLSY